MLRQSSPALPFPLKKTIVVGFALSSMGAAWAQQPSSKTVEPVTLETIHVKGFASDTVQVGAFRDQDPLDVPLTNNVVTRDVLDAQGARTLFGALRNTAGVTRSQLSGSTYDNISIRGILVENRGNYRLNGSLPIINLIDVPLENKERVEVLKGASSLYYGVVPPSGMVNFVTKRATREPVTSVATSVNEHGAADLHLDVGRKFGPNNDMGLRVNAAAGTEDVGIHNYSGDRRLLSLAYDWKITPAATLKVDLEHYRKDVSEQAAIALLAPVGGTIPLPAVPDNKTNLAGEWQKYEAEANNLLVRGDISLNDDWLLTLETGHATARRDRRYSQFQQYNLATGEGTLRITQANDQQYQNVNHRVEALGHVRTGTVEHELTVGFNYNEREQNSGATRNDTATQNLYNPRPVAPTGPLPSGTGSTSTIEDKGFYVFDRVSLGERWQLTAGLRNVDYESTTATTNYTAHKTTPSVSLLFKPMPDTSVYASYLEGLEETGTAPLSATNAGEVLPPAVNKQFELGLKSRLWDKALLQAALFSIRRAQTTTDTATGRFIVGGRSEYKGLELAASGEIGTQWSVIASALFMDAKIVESGDATLLGKTPENTPERTFSLFGEYRLPAVPGWSLNAGIYHVGERYVNNLNQATVGSYTTLSLGSRYTTRWSGRRVTLQANVDNATDKDYWSSAGNGLLGVGLPRTLRLAAKVDF